MNSTIFHITTDEAWEQAKKNGSYRDKSLDTEGFIHSSTKEQIASTLQRHFKGKTGLILLEINLNLLTSPLKYEESHGETFPHIYGEIPLVAIVKTSKIENS